MHSWGLVEEYNAHGLLWVKIKDRIKEGASTNCLINHSAVILLAKVAETYRHSCAFSTENFGVWLSGNEPAL